MASRRKQHRDTEVMIKNLKIHENKAKLPSKAEEITDYTASPIYRETWKEKQNISCLLPEE